MTTFSSDHGRKQKLDKPKRHAKMGAKEGYNGKYNMEAPNSGDSFYNVVEGLKISLLTVHDILQNNLHIGQTNHANLR